MLINDLKTVATKYIELAGVSKNSLSLMIFGGNNRNRIKRVFDTNRMEVGCFEQTMQWFSDNWPEGTEWPEDISRPEPAPQMSTARHETQHDGVSANA